MCRIEWNQVILINPTFKPKASRVMVTLLGIFWLSFCFAREPVAALAKVFAVHPPGSIQSIDAADQALAEAGQERAAIEARFELDERACYPKFFVTLCVDDAKERRRVALAQVHAVEVEA